MSNPSKLMDVNGLSYLYNKLKERIDSLTSSSKTEIDIFKTNMQADVAAAIADAKRTAAAAQASADQIRDYMYSAEADFVRSADFNAAISRITSFEMTIVDELPDTGKKGYIYLILADDGSGDDIYNEYLWIEDKNSFEKIGTTRIDLTPYAKTEYVNKYFTMKDYAEANYLNKTDAATTYVAKTSYDSKIAEIEKSVSDSNQTVINNYVDNTKYNADIDALKKADADEVTRADTKYLPKTDAANTYLYKSENAVSASKLATARNIAISGAVTGNANFDGSGNINISTSVNHSHNYAGSSSVGGVANSAAKLATARNIALTGAVTGNANFDGSGNISIDTSVNHGHSSIEYIGNHSEAASGTSANSPNTGMAVGHGLSLTGTYNDASTPVSYGNIINVAGAGTGQLLCEWSGSDSVTGGLYYRSHRDTSSGGWGPWKAVAYTDSNISGNAATASKLATARNIALTGAVTGNANFDGSGNIVITTTATKGTTAPTQLADGFLYYQYEN